METHNLLCQLDKTTQLVASSSAFIIKKLTKGKVKEGDEIKVVDNWVSAYFYSEIGDAIRGYVNHAMRKPSATLDGNIQSLVGAIEHMEETIKKIAADFTASWSERLKDPVEAHLLKLGDADE